MNNALEKILNGPNFFFCERFQTRMSKKVCIDRQNREPNGDIFDYVPDSFEGCKECKQGKEIKRLMIDDGLRPRGASDPAGRLAIEKDQKSAITNRQSKREEETMKTPCIVKGCSKEEKVRGLCETHYRLWKKGAPGIQPLPSKTSGKIKVVRPEVVKTVLPAVIINQDNSETYKAAAVMFIRSIERKVVDAIKVELEERGA